MKKLFLFIFVLFGCVDERIQEKYSKAYMWTCTYADTPETHMFKSRKVSMIFQKANYDDRVNIMKSFEDHGCKDWEQTSILVY